MSKFRKKQIIDAFQWFKHGDVEQVTFIPLNQTCSEVQRKKYGWLDTPQGGHTIFPGDWVIIDPLGNLSSCNPKTFTKLYEAVDEHLSFAGPNKLNFL